jgi:lysophospholipase L1-like esterase
LKLQPTSFVRIIATAMMSVACVWTSVALADAPAIASSGPTPYPTKAEDWPGVGVIRVFDWMRDNRAHFWRERQRKQGSIVFVGDSLTANWPNFSTAFPDMSVANRGIGGDVSRGVLFRLQEDVLALHPKAIVLLIGTNDLTAHQPAAQTLANLRDILAITIREAPEAPIVLCTVPPSANPKAPIREGELKTLNAGLRALASNEPRIELVDLFAATVDANGHPDVRWFKDDRLHLNAAGYARWKEMLTPALQAVGVL